MFIQSADCRMTLRQCDTIRPHATLDSTHLAYDAFVRNTRSRPSAGDASVNGSAGSLARNTSCIPGSKRIGGDVGEVLEALDASVPQARRRADRGHRAHLGDQAANHAGRERAREVAEETCAGAVLEPILHS